MPAPSLDRSWIVAGLAISGALAAMHPAAPTGLGGWDGVLRVAFAVLVPLAIGWSPRWLWFTTLGFAGVFAAGAPWLIVVGTGLALALGLEIAGRDTAVGRVGVGIAAAHGLANLRPVGPFAATAIAVGVVIAVCAAAALVGQGRSARRWVGTFGGLVAALATVFALVTMFALVTAAGDVDRGSDAARAGLEAVRDGDSVAAAEQLAAASSRLAAAESILGAWWVEPGRLVPVVGQHLAAARAAAGPVADVVEASLVASESADVDRLRLSGGAIDLPMIEAMRGPLAEVRSTMVEASRALHAVEGPWLIPRARDVIENAAAELDQTLPEAIKAAEGTRLLPGLLGADGDRRYLVMFAMPAESRELGGIMSTYLELTARDGVVTITDRGTAGQLNQGAVAGSLADPDAYPARFRINRPEQFATNWTAMTDLPLVARAASSLYPAFGGRPIDGVLYVDPVGVAALMALSGRPCGRSRCPMGDTDFEFVEDTVHEF